MTSSLLGQPGSSQLSSPSPSMDPASIPFGPRLGEAAERLRSTAADLQASAAQLGWRSPAATGFDAALGVLLTEFRRVAGRVDETARASTRHARRAADRAAELARASHLAGVSSRVGLASLAGAAPMGGALSLSGVGRLAGEAGSLVHR